MKMKPLFICYPRCSTCQKALKWLQERGIEVEVRDIVQQNPSEAELEEWIDRSGLVSPSSPFEITTAKPESRRSRKA